MCWTRHGYATVAAQTIIHYFFSTVCSNGEWELFPTAVNLLKTSQCWNIYLLCSAGWIQPIMVAQLKVLFIINLAIILITCFWCIYIVGNPRCSTNTQWKTNPYSQWAFFYHIGAEYPHQNEGPTQAVPLAVSPADRLSAMGELWFRLQGCMQPCCDVVILTSSLWSPRRVWSSSPGVKTYGDEPSCTS